jgi:spore germination protein GerM
MSGNGPRVALAQALLGGLLATVSSLASYAGEDDTASVSAVSSFKVYFNNDRLATDSSACSAVFAVDRTVPKTSAIAAAALRNLFRGPSSRERSEGYRSFFSASTAGLLRRVRIEAKTAYLDLNDMRHILSGATSSCGSAELQAQVERTLLQFPTVERVIYAIEGDPRTFYEWMNEPCSQANDNCDAAPFRAGR